MFNTQLNMPFNFNSTTKSYAYTPKDNPKDRVEVEIGDSQDSSQFFPQVKIKRWDNECNLSYRLNYSNIPGNISYSSDGDTITWKKGQYEARFYHVNDGEGAFEFDITIPKKPPINYLEFSLLAKDIEYFYQPDLTQEEKDNGASQPENVIGSYAVYAATPKTNWTGGTEYKCGKVGHIFRPQIFDASGATTWGELNITNGILRVTIPQDFLDKAVYPVRHAAGLTFGYTSSGSSSSSYSSTDKLALKTTGASGSAQSITFYKDDANSYNMRFGLYLHSDNSKVGVTADVDGGSSSGWKTGNLSGESISAVDYKLWVSGSAAWSYRYDSTVPSVRYTKGSTAYDAWADPLTPGGGPFTNANSIYCTYTAGGNTKQINIGDTWKDITAVQINIGDTWKAVTSVKINIGDVWKTLFSLILAILLRK